MSSMAQIQKRVIGGVNKEGSVLDSVLGVVTKEESVLDSVTKEGSVSDSGALMLGVDEVLPSSTC